MKTITKLSLFTAALLGASAHVHAITIYGLTSTGSLVSFDNATPGTIISTVNLTLNSAPLTSLVDIDFFPVTNELYGFTSTGLTYAINLGSGAALLRVTPGTSLTGITDADFNPQADRIRLHGAADTNFRLVPDVITAPSTAATVGTVVTDTALTPGSIEVVGNAYTNSFDGASSTTLYSIDTTSDSLLIHATGGGSPAGAFDATTVVGTGLGQTIGAVGTVGFDISATNGVAYLSNGNSLFTVNLTTGVATPAGTIGGAGTITTIAATSVPEPGSLVLGVLGALGLAARRQRRA